MAWSVVWRRARSPSLFRTTHWSRSAPWWRAGEPQTFPPSSSTPSRWRYTMRRMEGDAGRGIAENGRPLNQGGARVGRRSPFSAGVEERFQKAQGRVSGITLDAGGLIALDQNDRRVLALVARATERGMRVTIPPLR